jgi:hypothetical protein
LYLKTNVNVNNCSSDKGYGQSRFNRTRPSLKKRHIPPQVPKENLLQGVCRAKRARMVSTAKFVDTVKMFTNPKMVIKPILFLILLPIAVFAKPESKNVGLSNFIRVGVGYGWSEIQKSENTRVSGFDKPTTIWEDVDFMFPLGIHLGLHETYEQKANIQFSSGTKPGELYMTAIEFGARLGITFPHIQPYFGFGLIGGFLAVSDPTDRGNHNIMAAFDKVTRPIRGIYGQWGLDMVLTNGVGLRLSYHAEQIDTDKFPNLNDTHMHFQHQRIALGVVSWLR